MTSILFANALSSQVHVHVTMWVCIIKVVNDSRFFTFWPIYSFNIFNVFETNTYRFP